MKRQGAITFKGILHFSQLLKVANLPPNSTNDRKFEFASCPATMDKRKALCNIKKNGVLAHCTSIDLFHILR